MVLVTELYVSPSPVQYLVLRLLKVPLSELLVGDESVLRGNIDLGKENLDAVGDIEFVLVVDVVLGVRELLPLRPGLGGRGTADRNKVIPLPLTIVAGDLDLRDNRVERDEMAVARGENDGGGSELEAAVRPMLAACREGEEEEEQKGCGCIRRH